MTKVGHQTADKRLRRWHAEATSDHHRTAATPSGQQLADLAIALDRERSGSIPATDRLKRHRQQGKEKGSPSPLFLCEAVAPA